MALPSVCWLLSALLVAAFKTSAAGCMGIVSPAAAAAAAAAVVVVVGVAADDEPQASLPSVSISTHDPYEQQTEEHAQQQAIGQRQEQQQRDFSIIWLTDLHLDPLYDPEAPVKQSCHRRSEDLLGSRLSPSLRASLFQAVRGPLGLEGKPKIQVQARRLTAGQLETHSLQPLTRHHQHRYAHDQQITEAAEAAEAAEDPFKRMQDGETDPFLGRAGCDSSPALVEKALTFAASLMSPESQVAATEGKGPVLPPAAAVLLTGDYAAHFDESQLEQKKDALRQWTASLLQQFPQDCSDARDHEQQQQQQQQECVQLLMVAGNNDMPVDYLVPSARSEWTDFLLSLWKPALPSDRETKESFLKGLYYATRLRKAPGVVVLCLNTVLYSSVARHALTVELSLDEDADPAGQFAWMKQQLQRAREQNEQVVIAGHIPPGFSSHMGKGYSEESLWVARYTNRYRALVSDYSDIVIAQAFGHIHFGRIRVLSPEASSEVSGVATAVLGAPSISPIHGNNPALEALIFKENTGTEGTESQERKPGMVLTDYVQYNLPLFGFVGSAGRMGEEPRFSFEFAIHDTFAPFISSGAAQRGQTEGKASKNQQRIDGALAIRLGEALRLSPMAYALYEWHSAAGGTNVSSRVSSCEVLTLTDEERRKCLLGTEL